MALKEKILDWAGTILRVESLELGSTKPGVAGTTLSTSAVTASVVTATALVGGIDTRTDAGAISLTSLITRIVTTTGTPALTLANGTPGQIKIIVMKTDAGTATLTPTTKTGFTTITFDDVGDSAMLVYVDDTSGWMQVGTSTATAA